MSFDLADYLPDQRPAGERWPWLAAGILASYTVIYLAHIQGTRLLRLAIWPIAPVGVLTFWLTVDLRYKTTSWTGIMGPIFLGVAAGTRWAFADQPPSYRPLSHPVALRSVRDTTAFKAFNLIFIEARRIGLSDGPPFKPASQSRPYGRAVLHHLVRFMYYVIVIDIFTYPLYALDPTNLGRPWSMSEAHDWDAGVATMASKTGVPGWVLEAAMSLNYGWVVYLSMYCMWHLLAGVGIGVGLYRDEEYPPLMDAPWKATSHNDLWGRRYHQLMRSNFNLFTLPIAFLPPSFLIFRIFLGSAIYHQIIYYPLCGHFNFWPTLAQFMLPAVLCMLERAYKKATGRMVGGTFGRIWTWVGLILCMYPGVRQLTEIGWVSALRNEIAGEKSMLEILLFKIGLGPEPVKNLARGW